MKMAKLGKKAKMVVCYCDTSSKGEGDNCECWDSKSNPIVMTDLIRLRKKKEGRYISSPKRFRKSKR